MPLRDHFRPPIWNKSSWEGFHGMWPAIMVQMLVRKLPSEFTAEPRVHLGQYYEVDVCTFEEDEQESPPYSAASNGTGVTATALGTAPHPTLTIEAELPEQYAYEVLVFNNNRDRKLVAAVEIVSPANKDRPDTREAFVNKCAALLKQEVSVSIVDIVTTRRSNLYMDLLALMNRTDPAFGPKPPRTYAVTCRPRKLAYTTRLDTWAYALNVGEPLPDLPIWLDEERHVMLELEASYEETCRVLRVPGA